MPKSDKTSKMLPPRARLRSAVSSAWPFNVQAAAAIIIAAVFFAYLPALTGGFVLDDDLMVTENPNVKASDGLCRLWLTTKEQDYWPLTYTAFWIEWRLWGRNPVGYHAFNLILHVVDTLLICIVLRKLSIPGAFLAALIFAVHPVNVESVAWIAQLKNLMAMLFFLFSILWYLKTSRHSPLDLGQRAKGSRARYPALTHCPPPMPIFYRWYWMSLAAFVLAMLSKGSVAVMPVLLLGIVWWIRPLTRWDLLRTLPFFAVAFALAAVNVWFQTHGTGEVFRAADFAERILGAGGAIWFYLYKALLPLDLVFIYPMWRIQVADLLWWLALLAVLVVTGVLWWYRKSWSRPFLCAWGFFCVGLAPVLGFTDIGFMRYSLVADRYQHISIIGLIALAAAGWSAWYNRTSKTPRWPASIAALAAVGTLMFLTSRQCECYRDEVTLYRVTLQKNPQCWMVHSNLGYILSQNNQFQEAIEHFRLAVRFNPDYTVAHNNLGNLLFREGRLKEAIDHLQQALNQKKDYPEAHYNLAIALRQSGRTEEAIEHLREALRLKSDYLDARKDLAITLLQTDRRQEAIDHFEKALEINPSDPQIHLNLGIALMQIGRLQEAIRHCEQAIKLKPDMPEAYNNLGVALAQANSFNQALEQYAQALRLNPNYPEARCNLGIVLVQLDRPRDAVEQFTTAVRLRPDYLLAYNNLAMAYVKLQQPDQAIAAARKALEIAQAQGQTAQAKQIETWLNSYRAGLSK